MSGHRKQVCTLKYAFSLSLSLHNNLAPSSPPASFETSAIDSTAIFLSWEQPLVHHRNGLIRRYVIELHAADFDNITTITTEMNVTIRNLHPYTLYECRIAAETVSVGVFSDIQLERTQEAGIYIVKSTM